MAKGRGALPDVYALEAVKLMWQEVHKHLIAENGFRRTGTGYGGYSTGAYSGSEPVRNWQEEWHDEKQYGGPRFETRYWVKKFWADFNYTTSCMKLSCIKTGRWKGDITDMPDYELQAYCGTNLGIFDPGDDIHISTLINNLGHSGVNGSNTMGFAVELCQRGILKGEDFGFELKWGDVEAFEKLVRLIAKKREDWRRSC